MVPFESSLERDWVIALDFSLTTRSIHAQPFTVEYYNPEGRRRYYTPDFLATFGWHDNFGREWVYEVKYRDDLRENWNEYRPKFKAAMRYCRSEGLRFRVVTERDIRTPYVHNAAFLRRYREYPVDEAIEIELLRTIRILNPTECTPNTLLLAAYSYQPNRVKAIAHLWRLMDAWRVGFDPETPLTMNSLIWLEED